MCEKDNLTRLTSYIFVVSVKFSQRHTCRLDIFNFKQFELLRIEKPTYP